MESLYVEVSKRLLTTSNPFNYTNVSLKCLQIDETDPRLGKKDSGGKVQRNSGSMVHHWGAISTNSHNSRVYRYPPPTPMTNH